MKDQQTKLYPEILFYVVATPYNTHCVRFEVYDLFGTDEDGTKPYFTKSDDSPRQEGTEDIAEASPFISGDVKWDGCSNWQFHGTEQCMQHGCSRRDITRIGEILGRCWDMAAEMMPDVWYGE